MNPALKPFIGISAMILIFSLIYFVITTLLKARMNTQATQREISDADLVKLIHDQPDGLLSPHRLAKQTKLKLGQARKRLNAFYLAGVLRRSYNKRGRYYYGLREAYREPPTVAFSPDPFLTVDDLVQLFAAYEGKLTIQEMVVATRLPLPVLLRELKHFEKEKVVEELKSSFGTYGSTMSKFYVLQEPYRSDPAAFRERAGAMDLKLKELLTNDNLLV